MRIMLLVSLVALAPGCEGAGTPPIDAGADAAPALDAGSDAGMDAGRDAGDDASAPLDASTGTDASGADAATVSSFVALAAPSSGVLGADDLRYGRRVARLLLPTGQALQLYDPASGALTVITDFGLARDAGVDGAVFGVAGTTSADDGPGVVYAIDRRSQTLAVVDPLAARVVSSSPLAAQPDIVRYVAATSEVWVTEPSAIQIEIFAAGAGAPAHAAFVTTTGGCEGLAIDDAHGLAYTSAASLTLGVDVATHAPVSSWPHGCVHVRGLAADPRGFVVVDCGEGHLTVLDPAHAGAMTSMLAIPVGSDLIDLDATRHHVYVASPDGAITVASLDASGALALLGTLTGAVGARAVASDGAGHAFVIDSAGTRLVVDEDPFPPTP